MDSNRSSSPELGYVVVIGETRLHEACYRAELSAPISFVRLSVRQLMRRLDAHPPLAVIVSERVAERSAEDLLQACWIRSVPLYVAEISAVDEDVTREVESLLQNVDLPVMAPVPSVRTSELLALDAGWGG